MVCTLFMLASNVTLFVRDVLPDWLAGPPPGVDELAPPDDSDRRLQIGIFDANGRNVGRSWLILSWLDGTLHVDSSTWLGTMDLPAGLVTPEVLIETRLRFRAEDRLLDDLWLRVSGLPEKVQARGELYESYFGCTWRVGRHAGGQFVLDAQATRAMGDVLRPFGRLPALYVGRTWRLQLLNPLTAVVPGLAEHELLTPAELVRVTGKETIRHGGVDREVFIVQARSVKAWVAPAGDVLRQEVNLPLVGRLTLLDEPFDRARFEQTKRGLSSAAPED